jgi:hypothetical protein
MRGSSNTQAADDWYLTRVFFGCIGPSHTTPDVLTVALTDTSVTFASGISPTVVLKDGANVKS